MYIYYIIIYISLSQIVSKHIITYIYIYTYISITLILHISHITYIQDMNGYDSSRYKVPPVAAPYRLPERGWCVFVWQEELSQAVLLRVKKSVIWEVQQIVRLVRRGFIDAADALRFTASKKSPK